jgi:XRE family transcriptional regulator, regulator of sulfur utilization
MEKSNENEKVLLGQSIRSLRNMKGWTQQELGEHADVNYKFVGEIERGQQNPSFAVLAKIAAALGVELQELFRFEQEAMDRKDVENHINAILHSLPDEDLGQVLSVLRVIYPIK